MDAAVTVELSKRAEGKNHRDSFNIRVELRSVWVKHIMFLVSYTYTLTFLGKFHMFGEEKQYFLKGQHFVWRKTPELLAAVIQTFYGCFTRFGNAAVMTHPFPNLSPFLCFSALIFFQPSFSPCNWG